MPGRDWDVRDWCANTAKTEVELRWRARIDFAEGLRRTIAWYRALPDPHAYAAHSKRDLVDTHHSVSAVVACYKDAQAIPIMYERLTAIFARLSIDYEIIFVNDGSPDDSEEVIRAITSRDRRTLGITHARNFGSQAAFFSGMQIARKNACVLLDGDLQDPPELIEQFVAKWREGYDVVYGRRVKRDAPLFMQVAYKLFYRIFNAFSYIDIPHDAGDFSLMDRSVVTAMLRFPERDLFLRGVRAFVGFRQTGVEYVRPERMFGRTTNSLFKNIGWAKKGIYLLQQHAAEHHQRCRRRSLLPGHVPVLPADSAEAALPADCAARAHDRGAGDHLLWLDQSAGSEHNRRVHRQDFRRGQAPAVVHTQPYHPGWGVPGGITGGPYRGPGLAAHSHVPPAPSRASVPPATRVFASID